MNPADIVRWIGGHGPLLARTTQEHLVLSGTALLAVLAVALPLGIGLAEHPRAAGIATAIVNTLRTIPSLALLVLMLPVLGTGFLPSLVALALYGLPAVLLNTLVGLRGVDRTIVDAARGQGLRESQILFRVVVPLALPVMLAGIRTSAVQIISAATLAVFIGGGGFGELISAGMGLLDIPQLVVGAACVALLAVAAELGLGAGERSLARRFGTGP